MHLILRSTCFKKDLCKWTNCSNALSVHLYEVNSWQMFWISGISRDKWHKRRKTGGRMTQIRKKRKFELGRPAANTKVTITFIVLFFWPRKKWTIKDQFSSSRDIPNSVNSQSQIDACSWELVEFTQCGQWVATKNTEPFVWTQGTSLGDQRLSQERRVSLT